MKFSSTTSYHGNAVFSSFYADALRAGGCFESLSLQLLVWGRARLDATLQLSLLSPTALRFASVGLFYHNINRFSQNSTFSYLGNFSPNYFTKKYEKSKKSKVKVR